VQPSQIRQWKIAHGKTNTNIKFSDRQKHRLQRRLLSTKCKRFGMGGRKTLLPEVVTKQLQTWLEERCSNNLVVSLKLIQAEASNPNVVTTSIYGSKKMDILVHHIDVMQLGGVTRRGKV
jgi:hypothetical protein